MGFSKFVSLLVTQSLHLSRADRFDDPFEGSYSKINLALRPMIYKDMPKESFQQMQAHTARFSEWVRQWTLISCWHANEHESEAMWRLYSQNAEAVAVETDYETLAEILPDEIFLGLVNYIDYEKEWLPEGNTFYPFVHKRKSFEHEREVRAIFQQLPITDSAIQQIPNPDGGRMFPLDIRKLVKCVWIAPTAPAWFEDVVRETCRRFGFTFDIKKSLMAAPPVY